MRVVDLINKLNEIGFDETTELTFSTVNGDIGEWHECKFEHFNYGIDELGVDNCIDIEVNIPKEYDKEKSESIVDELSGRIFDVISEYRL